MKLKPSIYLTFITFILLLPHNAYSETTKTNSPFDIQNGQISLTYISCEVDMKKSIITFTGDVEATGNDMNMTCQKLVIYFKKLLKDSSVEDSEYSLDKIIATDSVKISRPDWGMAKSDEAVYYSDSEQIVLTGNPYFNDGKGSEGGGIGTVVTLYLEEERYTVQGTKENKANATIKLESGLDER